MRFTIEETASLEERVQAAIHALEKIAAVPLSKLDNVELNRVVLTAREGLSGRKSDLL